MLIIGKGKHRRMFNDKNVKLVLAGVGAITALYKLVLQHKGQINKK